MSLGAKKEYIKAIHLRYKNATRKEKSKILDEFCKVCQLSRKHAIRALRKPPGISGPKPGPKRIYNDQFVQHLVRLWKATRHMCSKRLKAALPIWLEYDPHPDLDDKIRQLLKAVSPSTIDRLLQPYRRAWKKGLSSTKPGSYIKSMIPIETLDSKVKEPGFIEADTVVHCGNSLEGDYANTLTITDLLSGWTETRAIWKKKSATVMDRIIDIRKSLPFTLKGFSCDNGSEFINHDLVRYLRDRNPNHVKFTRRRPYKKNDAAHVEQKNDVFVRQLFGYHRLDRADFVPTMNDIYRSIWNPFMNHFCPVMKLKKKVRIGGRVRKYYDEPKSPYLRLLDSGLLTDAQTLELRAQHETMNPFELKKSLDGELKAFEERVRVHNINRLVKKDEDAA
jgi:hypothetical protein